MAFKCLFIYILLTFLSVSVHAENGEPEWRTLYNKAQEFSGSGEYDKALQFGIESFNLAERNYGIIHDNTALTLYMIGMICSYIGLFEQSEIFLQESLDIRKNIHGENHPDVASSLNQLAMLYGIQGHYDQAEPLFKRSLEIREKVFGPEHPDVAANINELAVLYHNQGHHDQAEPLYKRSLEIYEKTLGPEHPDVATILNNFALLYETQGFYSKAETLYKHSLTIYEKTHGPYHLDIGTVLNNIGVIYHIQGFYAQAVPFYKRSLEIKTRTLGHDHSLVATTMNNLAFLYYIKGDYTNAEPLYRLSLEIKEKTLGPHHPDVAISLNNLALLYHIQGLNTQAEPLYKRSLKISENALGPDHPDVATSMNNLAVLYKTQGHYAQAEHLYKRSLEIKENALGPDHPDVATCTNNLAELYVIQGLYDQAKSLYKRSLKISENALGPEHTDVATSLYNLAGLYRTQGLYAQSESLYRRSLEIDENALGQDHPDVGTTLTNIAFLLIATNQHADAHEAFYSSLKNEKKLITQLAGFRTEAELISFLGTRSRTLPSFLSHINQHLRHVQSARGNGLDMWLQRKGLVLEAQKRFQEALVYSDNPEVFAAFQELTQARIRLSRLIFAGPGDQDIEIYRANLTQLEKERDALEARLVQLSQAYAERKKVLQADRFQVAAALPEATALIEFARIGEYDFTATGTEPRWLPNRYLAFILPAGKGDQVEWIDLGPAELIDDSVARFRKLAAGMDVPPQEVGAASLELFHLVFEPLQAGLGGVREVFISPDGNLNLLPFEALQDDQGRFLIEDYTFNYLPAGRDILGFGPKLEEGGKALFMGDPDFDMDVNAPAMEEEGEDRRSVIMELKVFRRLPGTRQEIERISGIVGAESSVILMGAGATEEALYTHRNPAILHLATHGFFREDKPIEPDDRNQDIMAMRGFSFVSGDQFQTTGIFVVPDNPLLRSGLILAGANRTIRGDVQSNSGIVTAEKILNLRLWGTDLVVLSACDTGMGDVRTGEGVFGLRRAFNQVGAKSLVMSMWKVPDQETQELMVNFYTNIYEHGMNYNQALRQAALTQLELTRKRYGHANPFYWGGFIFSGDPRTP